MAAPRFVTLDVGWAAEPNAPEPHVKVAESALTLSFFLDPLVHEAAPNEVGAIAFAGCSRFRWDDTNDHDWYAGTGRYSRSAPQWGRFYELIGDDPERDAVAWHKLDAGGTGERHFLFYFRDETFECLAERWMFVRGLRRKAQR